jgi:hypothetical protein
MPLQSSIAILTSCLSKHSAKCKVYNENYVTKHLLENKEAPSKEIRMRKNK